MSLHSSCGMEETGRTERIQRILWAPQPWKWLNLVSNRANTWQNLCLTGKQLSQCHGLSGRKWVKRDWARGKRLEWPVVTPSHCLLSLFWSVCTPGHLSKVLVNLPVQQRLPVMLWKMIAVPIALMLNTAERTSLRRVVREGQQQSCHIQQCYPPTGQVVTIATLRVLPLENSQQQTGIFCFRLCVATHQVKKKVGVSESSLEFYLCGFFFEP